MTATAEVQAIIVRCSRTSIDGRKTISWQNVANQLGWSVDKVRGLYDAEYPRFYAGCSPSREREPKARPEDLIEPPPPEPQGPEAFRSPHVRPLPLKLRILQALRRQTGSAETVASVTGTTVNAARATLSVMFTEGTVLHTHAMPYTWSLTPRGMAEIAPAVLAMVNPISAHQAKTPTKHGRANGRVAGGRA